MLSLWAFVKQNKIDPVAAMNELQDAGVVSDNCVDVLDVHFRDWESAQARLREVFWVD